MRLFAKYSRVNIVASVLALLIGGVVYYFSIRYVLITQLDDTLKVEEQEIMDHLAAEGQLPEPANYRDQMISYFPATTEVSRKFYQTRKSVPQHDHKETYRELTFSVRVKGQSYTVCVAKPEEETEYLLELIMLITAGMILLLLGTLFLANRLLLRRLWRPFYQTLDNIRKFNLSNRQPLPILTTDTEEFADLNGAVQQMTSKIAKDYEMLKNFTDNASHEMQTPLAIINSKLDLLIQDTSLRERHHGPIQAMYDAIGRLRQLNQSLLLLMKIENNQFASTEPADLSLLIKDKLTQLEGPLGDRRLTVETDLQPLQLPINGYLADILVNNLLVNVIRHNQQQGFVSIRLRDRSLQISNTGPAPGFDPTTIFNRFTKGKHSGGTGLGLAIVKQICDNYQFPLSYRYLDNMHVIEVRFPNPPLQNFDRMSD